ncbi:hypothetical protein C8R44DRAFT_818970 [Mycena epipterygia]|nr:hypothetical protein C8R44DRAFT_818970 [Mycena epipterygia]
MVDRIYTDRHVIDIDRPEVFPDVACLRSTRCTGRNIVLTVVIVRDAQGSIVRNPSLSRSIGLSGLSPFSNSYCLIVLPPLLIESNCYSPFLTMTHFIVLIVQPCLTYFNSVLPV